MLSIYFVVYLFIDIIVLSHLHRVLLETLVSLEHLVLTAKLWVKNMLFPELLYTTGSEPCIC